MTSDERLEAIETLLKAKCSREFMDKLRVYPASYGMRACEVLEDVLKIVFPTEATAI